MLSTYRSRDVYYRAASAPQRALGLDTASTAGDRPHGGGPGSGHGRTAAPALGPACPSARPAGGPPAPPQLGPAGGRPAALAPPRRGPAGPRAARAGQGVTGPARGLRLRTVLDPERLVHLPGQEPQHGCLLRR